MAESDPARHDLYTGLVDLLGPDRAGTLMAYLPKYDPTDLAAGMATLEARMSARFDAMDARFDSMDRRFESMDRRFESMDRRFDSMDRRFDRLFLTLVAGLFVVVAAMAGAMAAALG